MANFVLKKWSLIVLAFAAILYFYILISYFGLEEYIVEESLKEYMDSGLWHLEIWMATILMGSLFLGIEKISEKRIFRVRSFGFNILLKTLLYILALLVVSVLIYYFFKYTNLISDDQLKTYKNLITLNFLGTTLAYFGIAILFLNFLEFAKKKIGPENFKDLLLGKYFHPREEEYIFMFLDLKSSTVLAEQMGHVKYSRFLKECMHELTPAIQTYKARIYQYVGDEVVLFWNIKEGLNQLDCIKLFFDFKIALINKSRYFQDKFGAKPEFKAGMDMGKVTATEVGDIKREIAFHGDVLNTAARLEQKCNEYNSELIVSESLRQQIFQNNNYKCKFLSELPLKGKVQKLKYYQVIKN